MARLKNSQNCTFAQFNSKNQTIVNYVKKKPVIRQELSRYYFPGERRKRSYALNEGYFFMQHIYYCWNSTAPRKKEPKTDFDLFDSSNLEPKLSIVVLVAFSPMADHCS